MRPVCFLSIVLILLSACSASAQSAPALTATPLATQSLATEKVAAAAAPTPLPTRQRWPFGDFLPYLTQSGDTLPALAAHFNTTPDAIQTANPGITFPATATLQPDQPLNIPANWVPLMGTPFQIIPDSEFVYGPGQAGFSVKATIVEYNGFLSRYSEFADEKTRPGWEIIERVARDYSINPRLLLALVEYRSGALTQPGVTDFTYPLGYPDPLKTGLHNQLVWAAEQLSLGYYGWRSGALVEISLNDGQLERLDYWQNAGTAALHTLFGAMMAKGDFEKAVSPDGFGATFRQLFDDPAKLAVTLLPGNLQQPPLELPFLIGKTWGFTGGPHPIWGDNTPWGALDFAPPAVGTGCGYSTEWVAASADGVITRSDEAAVVLDLDGDGNEHTGWVVYYYHMGNDDRASEGRKVKLGDLLGHPSCEGGRATGTHVHVGRRYNGEWLPATGPAPFTLSGWTAHPGDAPYKGTMTYELPALKIVACTCVTANNSVSR